MLLVRIHSVAARVSVQMRNTCLVAMRTTSKKVRRRWVHLYILELLLRDILKLAF